ncbi:hypothetical protein C8R47DRAFT_1083408 [Mycena vitilis]|nr:hypothetical protein C8R47DRAFT_1083408 [Mycena vitilis]
MPVLPPASVAAEPARSPTPPQFTPRPDRIPQTNTLDDALAYWDNGCAPKGLNTPLKDWTTLFKSSEYTSEAVKLGNIRACRGDHGIFEGKYPGLRKKFTRLMKAVRVEQKDTLVQHSLARVVRKAPELQRIGESCDRSQYERRRTLADSDGNGGGESNPTTLLIQVAKEGYSWAFLWHLSGVCVAQNGCFHPTFTGSLNDEKLEGRRSVKLKDLRASRVKLQYATARAGVLEIGAGGLEAALKKVGAQATKRT